MGSYIFTERERRLLGRWLEGARGILLPGGEAEGGDVKMVSWHLSWRYHTLRAFLLLLLKLIGM